MRSWDCPIPIVHSVVHSRSCVAQSALPNPDWAMVAQSHWATGLPNPGNALGNRLDAPRPESEQYYTTQTHKSPRKFLARWRGRFVVAPLTRVKLRKWCDHCSKTSHLNYVFFSEIESMTVTMKAPPLFEIAKTM